MSSSEPEVIHRLRSGWVEERNAWVSCSCGWYRMDFTSRRAALRAWGEHYDFVLHATDPS